ncbi:diguanylate cyclase [Vibrio rotiferianus]
MLFRAYKINRWAIALLTVVYVLVSFNVIGFISDSFLGRQVQQARDDVQHKLNLVRYSIEANIDRDTYLADSFASVVALNPQFAMNNWSLVSEQFLGKANLVRNIGLAPDDIISHVYPLEGNEKAIGLDFRTVPNQYRTVQIAKQQKKVYVAGPLELVQGGTALIARYPIFTDIPNNEEYWGGLSVVIDYDKLIEKSDLNTLQGADIALTGYINGELIEGNEKVLDDYDLSLPIYLPSGEWTLFAKYTDFDQFEGIRRFELLFKALGWVTFSLFYVLIWFLMKNYLLAKNLSLHDELTRLPNRRFLFSELERIMSRSDGVVHLTVLNIDLNKFKAINDSLGHEAGDAVLKHIARVLTQSLRSSDFISRVGGDEFIVILQRATNPHDVQKIIENIQAHAEQNLFRWQDTDLHLSLSIGHYSYTGKADTSSINEILSKADISMYEVKRRNSDKCSG